MPIDPEAGVPLTPEFIAELGKAIVAEMWKHTPPGFGPAELADAVWGDIARKPLSDVVSSLRAGATPSSRGEQFVADVMAATPTLAKDLRVRADPSVEDAGRPYRIIVPRDSPTTPRSEWAAPRDPAKAALHRTAPDLLLACETALDYARANTVERQVLIDRLIDVIGRARPPA